MSATKDSARAGGERPETRYRCEWCKHEWSHPLSREHWVSCPSCHGSFSFSGLTEFRGEERPEPQAHEGERRACWFGIGLNDMCMAPATHRDPNPDAAGALYCDEHAEPTDEPLEDE